MDEFRFYGGGGVGCAWVRGRGDPILNQFSYLVIFCLVYRTFLVTKDEKCSINED